MKKSTKKTLLGIVGLALGALMLSSCTATFCSNEDLAMIAYPYEQGVTVYLSKTKYDEKKAEGIIKDSDEAIGIAGPALGYTEAEIATWTAEEQAKAIYKYIPYSLSDQGVVTYTAEKAVPLFQSVIIGNAVGTGHEVPSLAFWGAIDEYAVEAAVVNAAYRAGVYHSRYSNPDDFTALKNFENNGQPVGENFIRSILVGDTYDYTVTYAEGEAKPLYLNPYKQEDTNGSPIADWLQVYKIPYEQSVLRQTGYVRLSSPDADINNHLFGFLDMWTNLCRKSAAPGLGIDGSASEDFIAIYRNRVASVQVSSGASVSGQTTCIATNGNRNATYGHYGRNFDWTAPITQKTWAYAWSKGPLEGLLVYPISWLTDTFAFAFDSSLSGVGQILALLLVTVIVRLFFILVTFKSTLDQQKMQTLQPQMAKLQEKYPNSNTNQAEKQRLSQEQMALYRRNKVNPLSQLLVLIIQFPLFICVWSGLRGSAALSSGSVLNLRLSDTIQSTLTNFSKYPGYTWYANDTGWWTALALFLLMAIVQVFAMLLPRLMMKARLKDVEKMGKNPAQDQNAKRTRLIMIGMTIFTIVMGFMLPAAMGVYWLVSGLIGMIQTVIIQLIMAKKAKKRG